MALHALCLFDGYGGFELGFRLAGLDVRTVARVERDSHAAATLVARMDEATLDRAPVWDDVTTFDGRPWAGRVDLITAGFNCQPFSAAGQQRGVDDERWLWPDIARIVAEVGPRYVYLENVPGLVRLGLPYVLADLAALGFDAEWGCLSAAAVGATHRRDRFWLLAFTQRSGRRPTVGADDAGQLDAARSGAPDLADANRDGCEVERRIIAEQHHADGCCGADVADAEGVGGVARARRAARDGRAVTWPPGPDDTAGWDRWRAQGGPEPSVRRITDGRPLGLAESLHLGGNGLVPRVAAEALAQLAERAQVGRMLPLWPD